MFWKPVAKMYFHSALLGEEVEHIIRQGGSAMLYRTAHAVFFSGQFGELSKYRSPVVPWRLKPSLEDDAAVGLFLSER